MSEPVMTRDEIRLSYPDEWVVLVDLDEDSSIPHVRGGRVAGHGSTRRGVLAETALPPGAHWALRYTGQLTGPFVFFEKYAR